MDNKALEALGTMYLRLVTFDPDNAVYWTEKMAVISDALYNAPAKDNWQPIETAPHETLVLLYWHDALLDDCMIEVAMASHGKLYPNGISSRSRHGRATHWMPLPKPPKTEE